MDEVTTEREGWGGARNAKEELKDRYQGVNIVEATRQSVGEAARAYAGHDFARPLAAMVEVGLGYLRLNQ